jgi:N-acetylmuramoyl-L-alanine amidase
MKGVGEVTVRKVDGLYKYHSGRFSDYRAARAHARKMADIVPGAFLTAFEGDKPIPLKEAIDIWRHNRK